MKPPTVDAWTGYTMLNARAASGSDRASTTCDEATVGRIDPEERAAIRQPLMGLTRANANEPALRRRNADAAQLGLEGTGAALLQASCANRSSRPSRRPWSAAVPAIAAIVPGGDSGQNRKSATGRSVNIAPVSSVTISNGDVSMPEIAMMAHDLRSRQAFGKQRGARKICARATTAAAR